MSEPEVDAYVFSDDAGHLYVIPREVFEQSRVADENKTEVERLVSPEVSGFAALGASFSFMGPVPYSPFQPEEGGGGGRIIFIRPGGGE
jgi:hypothetical protein